MYIPDQKDSRGKTHQPFNANQDQFEGLLGDWTIAPFLAPMMTACNLGFISAAGDYLKIETFTKTVLTLGKSSVWSVQAKTVPTSDSNNFGNPEARFGDT